MSEQESAAQIVAKARQEQQSKEFEAQLKSWEEALDAERAKVGELEQRVRDQARDLDHKVQEAELLREQYMNETIRAERLAAQLRITEERAETEARALTLNIKLLSMQLLEQEEPETTTQEEGSDHEAE